MDIPDIYDMCIDNIKEVEEIEQRCFSSPWSLDSLASELSNPLAVFKVASVNGQIVGYAGMHHIIDEGYITNIAVLPEYRRRKIANELMLNLIKYAQDSDLKMITLEARQSNTAAQELYKSLKFEVVGIRKNFYSLPTEDAILMTREFK